MSKGTTIKEALAKFEEKNGKASDCKEVKLTGMYPPIEKMDASLSTLTSCERLSLSTNAIEKIANLNGLSKCNNILWSEAVGDTLMQLWISNNNIEKLKGINVLKKLKILWMSNNKVAEWSEFNKLIEMPCLEDLLFVGNPLEEKQSADGTWKDEVAKKLPKLKKLDGVPIVRHEEED
ncbi:dynein light chain 1, axonemal [Elysia marginata]|uniref:Dynein axonemal light chain 1 n=1 Tax=Elysia marginata TaxID=1093978 RepID=A0AAV4HHB5_9GAST|nr:dynein light chain 1, axonemal [Elysia marginata]